MELSELVSMIKSEYPKNAIEIKECLMLLSESIDSTISDIQKGANDAFASRKFDKVGELTQFAKKLVDVQTNLEQYTTALELEDTKAETEVINQQDSEQKIESHELPNYSDYAVDSNIPYNLYEDFTHKCPAAFSILGTKVDAKQWKNVFLLTCKILSEKNMNTFLNFVNDSAMQGKKIRYFSKEPENMRKPVQIESTDIFVETNMSSNQIRNVIIKMLKRYDISLADYQVFLRADYTGLHNKG